MSIFDVQHQPRAHRIIQRALSCERMPHAYLFAGPEGVGKEMLAHALAQTLLCESPVRRAMPETIAEAVPGGQGADACGECQDCRLVGAGTHPDLFLIYRQLNRQHPDAAVRKQKALVLGVEVIRHFLIDRVGTRPSRRRAKVFIVREAERLNESAQNSLLKTLEEPPDATFIILLTHAMDRMLPTTRSRCQQVVFQSLPDDYVADRLRVLRRDAEAPEVTYIARHAGGCLGAALRQIDDGLYALKRTWGDRLAGLFGAAGGHDRESASGRATASARRPDPQAARGPAPHELARPFTDDAKTLGNCVIGRDPEVSQTDATRVGLQSLLAVLADFYLDALRQVNDAQLPQINADQPEVIDQLAQTHTTASLVSALKHLSDAETNLARNAHIELTLETLFIRLAQSTDRPLRRGEHDLYAARSK